MALIWKLLMVAEKRVRKLNAPHLLPGVLRGDRYEDSRALSNSTRATVAGPVGISVADARVEEGAGAVLAFVVTLSRPANEAVTVDYTPPQSRSSASSFVEVVTTFAGSRGVILGRVHQASPSGPLAQGGYRP